jgi:hypothetical protein
MRMNQAFPSAYLKADTDEVPEEGFTTLTIEEAKVERLGQGKDAEDKVVLYFRETRKGLVMNKTNWKTLTDLLGSDDTDDWEGRQIQLYSTDVQFGLETMRGIRIRSKLPKPGKDQPATMTTAKGGASLPPSPNMVPDDDDDAPPY